MLSDGFFEAESPDGEELGADRVNRLIASHAERRAEDILAEIKQTLDGFTAGAPASDDRTAILIKRVS